MGYSFKKKELLLEALTHPSVDPKTSRVPNNQRLEFLGDSILGAILAGWLYKRFPNDTEGELSKKKALLARGRHLAVIARSIDLGAYTITGKSEGGNGEFRDALLEDALEGIIGAVFLDGGFAIAKRVVLAWVPSFEEAISFQESSFNPKGQLQETLQSHNKHCRIKYEVIKESGRDHQKEFTVAVSLNGKKIAQGQGGSKQIAQENAARRALGVISGHNA